VTPASFSPQQCKNNREKGQFFITIAIKKVTPASFSPQQCKNNRNIGHFFTTIAQKSDTGQFLLPKH
jgi:hypothetical protein